VELSDPGTKFDSIKHKFFGVTFKINTITETLKTICSKLLIVIKLTAGVLTSKMIESNLF
jgi:hypothetical protein